jgi:hypothetical protein
MPGGRKRMTALLLAAIWAIAAPMSVPGWN